MRIGRTQINNKSMLIGIVFALVALVIPVVSEPIIKAVTSIRDKVSGLLKKK